MTRVRFAAAALTIVVATVVPAAAQQTRAELLAAARAEKAKRVEPYKPKGIERVALYIEDSRLIERLTVADGWYPRIGGLTTGGGFAGGVGYRKHLADERMLFDVSGAISTKAYKALDLEFMFPRLWNDRIEFWTFGRYRDFPQEDFFGIGPDTRIGNRTNYAIESTEVMGRALVHVRPWLRVGADIGLLNPNIGEGTDPRFPTVERFFTEIDAPGLVAQPSFVYTNGFVEVDYRDYPGNPRSGALWRATVGNWDDRDLDQFDFARLDAEAVHYFPVFDKKRVFVVRGVVSYVNNDPGERVPFYVLPYVGGADTVRSVVEFRFRDENALTMNAEYRWETFSGLDMALFFDAGKVTSDWQDIDFSNLKTAYGIGFRFNTYKSVFLRLDIAAGGGEGTRYFLKFGPSF
jgi:hypothetical protein